MRHGLRPTSTRPRKTATVLETKRNGHSNLLFFQKKQTGGRTINISRTARSRNAKPEVEYLLIERGKTLKRTQPKISTTEDLALHLECSYRSGRRKLLTRQVGALDATVAGSLMGGESSCRCVSNVTQLVVDFTVQHRLQPITPCQLYAIRCCMASSLCSTELCRASPIVEAYGAQK
jgi:hypothetical protein